MPPSQTLQENLNRVTGNLLDQMAKVTELQAKLANVEKEKSRLQNRLAEAQRNKVQVNNYTIEDKRAGVHTQKIKNQRDELAKLNRTKQEMKQSYDQQITTLRNQLAASDRTMRDLRQQLATVKADAARGLYGPPPSLEAAELKRANDNLNYLRQELVAERQEVERLANEADHDYKRAQRYKIYSKDLENTLQVYDEGWRAYNAGRDAAKSVVELLKQGYSGIETSEARNTAVLELLERLEGIIDSAPPVPEKPEARGSSEAPRFSANLTIREKQDVMEEVVEDGEIAESQVSDGFPVHPDRLRRAMEEAGSSDGELATRVLACGPQRTTANSIPVSSKRRLGTSSESTLTGEPAFKVPRLEAANLPVDEDPVVKTEFSEPSITETPLAAAMADAARFEATMMAEAGVDQDEIS